VAKPEEKPFIVREQPITLEQNEKNQEKALKLS
jgi:hypothetical protein